MVSSGANYLAVLTGIVGVFLLLSCLVLFVIRKHKAAIILLVVTIILGAIFSVSYFGPKSDEGSYPSISETPIPKPTPPPIAPSSPVPTPSAKPTPTAVPATVPQPKGSSWRFTYKNRDYLLYLTAFNRQTDPAREGWDSVTASYILYEIPLVTDKYNSYDGTASVSRVGSENYLGLSDAPRSKLRGIYWGFSNIRNWGD